MRHSMFETHQEAERPIPPGLGDPGVRAWSYAVCRLFVPWLHVLRSVTYQAGEDDDETYTLHETLFLTEVEQLLQLQQNPQAKIVAVDLMSPGPLNGTNRWKLEPLAEIWEGLVPQTHGQRAFIYVLADGKRYVDAALDTPESELLNKRQLLRSESVASANSK
ncbi:MAG: hypothetical protein HY052_04075 [Proteobacteria bacterium]|nr:hypothetical protein [Pseudomonadota bacterium]